MWTGLGGGGGEEEGRGMRVVEEGGKGVGRGEGECWERRTRKEGRESRGKDPEEAGGLCNCKW